MGRIGYYLPTIEIKDYNVMTDGRNFFDQHIRNDTREYENIIIATIHCDDYTIGCLLNYHCFKENKQQTTSKQQVLNADPKAIQHYFYWKSRTSRKCMDGFHSRRSKRNQFGFFTRNCDNVLECVL